MIVVWFQFRVEYLKISYTSANVDHESQEKCQGCPIVAWNARATFVRPGDGFFIVASPVTAGNAQHATHDDGDAE